MTASPIVPAEGPMPARIAICGEAPGANEVVAGRPFVGGAGKVLDGLLARAKIDREACYVTNVMKVRPPGNNFEHFYTKRKEGRKAIIEPSQELKEGIMQLHAELRAVGANVIVTLGNEPLKAVLGITGDRKST